MSFKIKNKMFALKVSIAAKIQSLIWPLLLSIASASPQLDLPPINTVTPTPEIYYNGYTPSSPPPTPQQARSDYDRNIRHGPPYADDEGLINDRQDDFRLGQQLRYGYNYPQPHVNFTNDSPFSDKGVQANDNINYRYPNHNYDGDNNQFGDRYANNFNLLNEQQQRERERELLLQRERELYRQRYNNDNRFGSSPRPFAPPLPPTQSTSTYRPNDQYNPQNPFSNEPNNPYNRDPNRPFDPNQQNYPNNPNNPNNNQFPQDARNPNPFVNPYGVNGQDRFNLNDRFYNDRQRFQQDRRYQIELEKLRNLLVETDQKGSLECTANVAAQWNFETNVNEFTQAQALNAQQHYVEFQRLIAEQAKNINKELIFDRRLYRQLMLLSEVGPNALPFGSLERYNRLINEMLFMYNSASICAYQQPFHCDLHYIPELKEIMAKSRDWDELQHTWLEYHRKAGREMRDSYEQLIDVMNEVAVANNITDGGEYWYSAYESGNFRQDTEIIWEQIRPLYELLHAYVRRKLRDYYGPERINRIAPLPTHILGNMFGQSWSNILDIVIPYPGRKLIDVTPSMLERGYTPLLMFQLAEEFFRSINMSAVGPEFYQNSLLEQPPDRQVLCEPSAWDFCNRHDFRVKICSEVNQKSFVSAHHEMAHVQYFLQYRHLPKIFRNGANPAFHQAIGDAIGLSVSTPKHFQALGLLQRSVDESSYDINYLFTMAIDKVAFLPFALALDNWRYDVFSGRANKHMMNCHFWDLRERYGGIKPPVLRSEKDFDPGAKYHIPANIPYIKYFVSTILQFQIYRAMCRVAGQYEPNDPRRPLHKCDVYRQPAAGNLLKQIMAKGASQPWQEVLEETLGEGRLDGSALREYFAPLEEWLRLENLRTNEFVGWNYDGDYCKRSIETAGLQVYGAGFYNAASRPKSYETLHLSIILTTITIFYMCLLSRRHFY